MTEQEKNIIKNEIIDAIAAQSKTIEDLAPVSSVTDSDLIELNGGRNAALSVLRNYFGIPTLPSLDGYLTKTIADGLYQPKGSYAAASHTHAFSALTGVPTTLGGYGITDAGIANDGTITLGNKSIRPLTQHQSIYALAFKAGAFSAKSYDPTGAAASVNIPTLTDHVGEGANLYFTDARAVAALKSTTDALSAGIDKKLDKSLFDGLFVPYMGDTALTWAQVHAGSVYDSVKLNAGLWTESFLTAKGRGSGIAGGGSFDPSILDDYAKKQWVQSQGYVTAPTLAAYLTKAKADSLYQPLGDYAAASHTHSQYALASSLSDYALASSLTAHTSDTTVHISTTERTKWNKTATDLAAILGADSDTIINKWEEVVAFLDTYTEADTLAGLLGNKVDKVAGYGLSKNDFNDTLLAKLNGIEAGANKYVHPAHTAYTVAAATGRVLSAISVDALGHVTSVASKALTAADIPALAISKVTGLQDALDAKAQKKDFEDFVAKFDSMFRLVNTGTDAAPKYAIEALYGVYTYEFLTAKGRGGTPSQGGTFDPSVLDGYAEKAWVQQQGYVTSATLSAYLTKTKADTLYQPVGNYALASHSHSQYALASSLNDHIADTVKHITATERAAWNNKVDKVAGKGLSENDFTDALLSKLNGIAAGANNYVLPKATADVLGGVRIGANISLDAATGKISTHAPYVHPSHTIRNIAAAAGLVLASVSVNALGHVTNITSKQLAAADIPALAISKITGLQGVLDAKAAKADLEALRSLLYGMFTPYDGNTPLTWAQVIAGDSYDSLKANGGLWTESFMSAKGKGMLSGGSGSGSFDPSVLDGYAQKTWVQGQGYITAPTLQSYLAKYLPYAPLNGGLSAVSSVTTWGVGTGTTVAEWDAGGSSIKLKKDCPAASKLSLLIDGTVYVNEGQDAVATQVWADGRYSLLGHTHSQYLTSHQSLAAYMRFEINANYVNASFGTTELSKKAADTYVEFWDGSEGSGWFNFHTGYLVAHGKVQGTSIVKEGGTASQFLMADGSVDGNSYALSSSLANYYTKTEADGRYMRHFWTSDPGYDCSTCNDKSLVSFTYANNAPFTGAFIDVNTNGYGFYLGTGYNGDYSLYYRRHGRATDGGMGAWQRLARVTDTVANANALGGVALERFVYGDNATGTHDLGTALSDTARKSGFYRANSDDYASLFIHCSHSTNTYAFQIGTVYTDSSLKFRHLINNTWSSWRTLLDTTNYASTLDSRYYTETEINTKLSAYLTTSSAASTYAKLASPNNLVHSGNEITIIPSGFSGDLWLNHKTTGGPNGAVNAYYMGNGAAGVADVVAKGFVKMGSSDSYLLLGGGGHKAVSDFLLRSGGTMTNTNVVTNLNADLLDGHHKRDFNGSARYGTTAQPTSGYYKIKIKSTAAWMLGFKILAYQNYCFDEIDVSGYNYGAYYWYQAAASLVCSQGLNAKSSIVVTFGYDSAWNLWVAIPATYYAGITVTDVTNGYNQVADYHSLFEIVYEATLTGTVQTTVTASRHAMLTDNVASATKLATPRAINGTSFDGTADITTSRWGATRTLWGRSCNGSANIAGDMTGVGHITMSGYIYSDKTGTARSVLDYHGDGSLALNWGLANAGLPCVIYGNVGIGKVPTHKLDVDGAARVSGLAIATGGVQIGSTDDYGWYISSSRIAAGLGTARGVNVGNLLVSNMWADYTKVPTNGAYIKGVTKIGTDTASYALNAASFICDSWVRTKGATGWYNETYGGGWYMNDGTYIRNHNSKRLALKDTSNTDGVWDLLRLTGGGITIDKYGGGVANSGAGRINLGIPNNSSQTPLMIAFRENTQYATQGSANRLFAMELLNNGALLDLCFGGAMKFRMYRNGELYATAGMYTPGFMAAKKTGGSSDERLKKNIRERRLGIDTILGAPCVGFDWRDGSGRGVGTLAQYWLRRLPEVVLTDPDGYYAVDYGALAHIEVSSLAKYLAPKIEDNEAKIKRLEKRVAILEKENRSLKARAGGKKNKESSTL